MASINDLATAATIASSAVALQQSSPTQPQPPPQDRTEPGDTSRPTTPSPAVAGEQATTTAAAAAAAAAVAAAAGSGSAAAAVVEETPLQTEGTTVAPPATTSPSTGARVGAAPSTPTSVDRMDGVEETGGSHLATTLATTAAAAAEAAAKGKGKEGESSSSSAGDNTAGGRRKPPVRGALIVFEGMDRAGKTTQAKLLQVRCVEGGRDVRFMRFPDRSTPIGQMIDSYLKGQAEIEDHVIHLLFSANRWEAAKKIKADLAAGRTVICDRFYHSGIVYSAAKQNPSLSLSWAKAPEVGLPRPDVVLFLDLYEEVARQRGGWGGEVYEKGEMQRRVRDLFWGLSMGDLGSAVSKNNSNNGHDALSAGNPNVPGATPKTPRTPLKSGRRDSGGGAVGVGGVGPGHYGGENGEFRQEEEDIQIVDADLGVEELSEKVWETVLPRLEAVERGEVGHTVRLVR